MKTRYPLLISIFLCLAPTSLSFAHASAEKKDAEINTKGMEALVNSKIPMVILDARPAKFAPEGRIPGAKYMSDQVKPEQAVALISSKDALIVTYCDGIDCPLSVDLAEHMKKLGYKNVIEYREGIEGWLNAGLPVDKVK